MKLVLLTILVLVSATLANPNQSVLDRMETVSLSPKGPFAAAVDSLLTQENIKLVSDMHHFGRLEEINSELREILTGNAKKHLKAEPVTKHAAEQEMNLSQVRMFKKLSQNKPNMQLSM